MGPALGPRRSGPRGRGHVGARPPAGAPGEEQATENRFQKLRHHLPYGGLAVSVALAVGLGPYRPLYIGLVLGLSAAAALWLRFTQVPYPTPAGGERVAEDQAVVRYAGLMFFVVALVLLNPFFGFFGFTGYLQIGQLRRGLRPPALVCNAAVMALSQIGGPRTLHGAAVAAYVGLFLVNILVAGSVTHQGMEQARRSRRRARMIDELAEANRRLRETLEENAGLHAQLVTQAREAGILDERQRMAGEIHDTIAQGLTGVVTQLEAADRFDDDPRRRARHRELARRMARESLAEARRSVRALRPGPLDAAPHLPAAIADLADQWTRTSGIPVRVEATGDPVALRPALEVVLFRTAQEGLANIVKHAGASRAGLTLSYTHEVVVLDVLDDGAGFDPAAAASAEPRADGHGFGLTAMRQRLRQVGGCLAIESAPGDGTALSARVPAVVAGPDTPAAGERPPSASRFGVEDRIAPDRMEPDRMGAGRTEGRTQPGRGAPGRPDSPGEEPGRVADRRTAADTGDVGDTARAGTAGAAVVDNAS